jgi:hypothetical protein
VSYSPDLVVELKGRDMIESRGIFQDLALVVEKLVCGCWPVSSRDVFVTYECLVDEGTIRKGSQVAL